MCIYTYIYRRYSDINSTPLCYNYANSYFRLFLKSPAKWCITSSDFILAGLDWWYMHREETALSLRIKQGNF